MNSWSLTSQLCGLADTIELREALVALNMLSHDAGDFTITTVEDWHRGGAETFIYRFRIACDGFTCSDYILKACVPFSPATPIEYVLNQWHDRRILLSMHGVRTPTLHAIGNGVLLEEFIPHSISDLIRTYSDRTEPIAQATAHLAGVVARLRFIPTDLFSELRTHGTDSVMIDFGSDLGPPNAAYHTSDAIWTALLRTLSTWNIKNRPDLQNLREIFESSLHDGTRAFPTAIPDDA
jgi:hypothetical protein